MDAHPRQDVHRWLVQPYGQRDEFGAVDVVAEHREGAVPRGQQGARSALGMRQDMGGLRHDASSTTAEAARFPAQNDNTFMNGAIATSSPVLIQNMPRFIAASASADSRYAGVPTGRGS